MESRTTLDTDPRSAARARRFVVDALASWNLAEPAETAALLVTELVTNAILHAHTEIELIVAWSKGLLTVAVRDGSPTAPSRRHHSAESGTGRGLVLVDALADEWGVEQTAGGKSVWFALRAPATERGAG